MTAIDPYRTLGLTPGASQVEIKRAYRHLAKLYHPDSAGDRALGRFLAIQAAYEALIDERGRGRGYRRPTAATRPAPPPAAPWQADASRARATREANRARTRRSGPASGGPAGPGSGARPEGPSTASSGTSDRAGTASGPAAADGPDRTGRGRGDPAAGSTGTGPSATGGTAGRRSRRSRGPKATIGSTSYDGADKEPFDPAWEGATWYGAGSGTYWTLNPKEYADPRKHGPEYLARSRRGVGGTAVPGGPAEESQASPAPDAPSDDDGRTADASSDRVTSQPRPGPGSPAEPARASTKTSAAGSPRTGSGPIGSPGGAGPATGPPPVEGSTSGGPSASGSPPRDRRKDPTGTIGRTVIAGEAGAPSGPPAAPAVGFVPPSSAGLAQAATTLPGRILLAVVGWIPIGVALAIATELMPACSGSSLVCADPLRAGIWPLHLLVIGLLASLPRLALVAAYGSGAFLAVGLLATPVLIAIGGAQTPDGTAAVLRIVLAAAWLGGIWIAVSGRVDLPPWRGRRVR